MEDFVEVDILAGNEKNGIKANLAKIQVLIRELDIVLARLKSNIDNKKNLPHPKGINRVNLLDDNLQVEINMYLKAYFFIYRQAITKYFRVLLDSRELLGFLKVARPFPNLSVSSGFKRNLEKLMNDEYDFDQDILKVIKEGSDFLILSRVLRNAIKSKAVVNSYMNYTEGVLKIVIPIDDEEKRDGTLNFLKEKPINLDHLDDITIKSEFLDNTHTYLYKLWNVLIDKLEDKIV